MINRTYFTKKDAVAESLRNEILSGMLTSGSQLLQAEVAEQLNVSPTPVREAFRMLEAEGLIINRPHRGVVVAEQDYEDQKAIYEIRTFVEVRATRRAIARMDASVESEVAALVTQSERALRTADLHVTREANARFHEVLAAASGTQVYTDLARMLISRSRFYLPLTRDRMTIVLRHHRAILRAIRARDVDQAAALMEKHMTDNLKWLYEARTKAKRTRSPKRR